MSNIYSNNAALTSLRAVNLVNSALQASAERIASGRRIATAKDGANLWALATAVEADNRVSSTVKDSLAITRGVLAAAEVGLDSASASLQDIRDLLVSARSPGADRVALQVEIDGLSEALRAIAKDATIGGTSLLNEPNSPSYNPVKSFVSSVVSTGGQATQLTTIDLDTRGIALINGNAGSSGILDKRRTVNGTNESVLMFNIDSLSNSAADARMIDDFIAIVDLSITDVTKASERVGITQSRVENQSDFLDRLTTIRATAVSRLVDANLEEEAAQKDALVVRQQLAIEALSIANNSLANILRLFD